MVIGDGISRVAKVRAFEDFDEGAGGREQRAGSREDNRLTDKTY